MEFFKLLHHREVQEQMLYFFKLKLYTMKMKLLILSLGILLPLFVFAQNQGTLQGNVTEARTGDIVINASLKLLKAGITKIAIVTDFEGNYSVNIDPGTYDVEVKYEGMKTGLTKGVVLNGGIITRLDIKLEESSVLLNDVVIKEYSVPMIKEDNTTSGRIITSEQITNAPTRNIDALESLKVKPTTEKKKTAKPLSAAEYAAPKAASAGDMPIKGKRKEGTVYMADGIPVMPSAGLPPAETAPEPPPPPAKPARIEVDEVFDMPSRAEKKEEKSKSAATTHKTLLDAALDIRAGRVTASENSDFKHWDFWNDKTKNEGVEEHQRTWGFQQFERYPIVVTNQAGYPLSNVALSLKSKGGSRFWECRTDNLGRAEAWLGMFDIQKGEVFL